jgi:hypothetical protein
LRYTPGLGIVAYRSRTSLSTKPKKRRSTETTGIDKQNIRSAICTREAEENDVKAAEEHA